MIGLEHKSLISPILVGRGPHLDLLEHLKEQSRERQGQAILLAGEAGVGKSRLTAELKRRAEREGFAVLQGNCSETEQMLPYAPLLNLLRGFFLTSSQDQATLLIGPYARNLIKLLPELAPYFPDFNSTQELDPQQEKQRLFQTLAELLSGLTTSSNQQRSRPLLFVLEDLHWCDEVSLEFVLYFIRRIRAQSVLCVLTYRGDEVSARLNHFLASLDREHLATELVLAALNRNEVEEMIRAIFDLRQAVRPEFLERIYALTDGNPFFVEEVLKSLLAAGEIYYADGKWERKPIEELHIPRSVQDAVQRRTEVLSASAQELLTVAAVAGQRFDLSLLQELMQMNEHTLVQNIKQLLAAQLVVEESADQFAFRHTLTREAVYATLLRRERKALHRHIAQTIERVEGDTVDGALGQLAYHYYAAEEWQKAAEYARRAGERAQSMYAPHEAIGQFDHAIQATEKLGRTAAPDLVRARGHAYETIGELDRAREDYEREWNAAHTAGDAVAESQALLDLGFLWASRDYARAGDYFQQALQLARNMNEPASLAHTLNRVGNWYVNLDRPGEGLRHHREALAIFESLNDRAGLAETLDLLGLATEMSGDLVESARFYSQVIPLWRDLGNQEGLASSLTELGALGMSYTSEVAITAPFTLAQSVNMIEEALKIARQINWRAGEAYALGILSIALGPHGEYSRAFPAARELLKIAEEIDHVQWLAFAHWALAWLYQDLLALPEARTEMEQAVRLGKQAHSAVFERGAAGVLASIHIQQNDLGGAEAVLNALSDGDPRFLTSFEMSQEQLDARTSPTLLQRPAIVASSELALARGEALQALNLVDYVIATSVNLTRATVIPRLWRLRGEALTRLRRFEEAESVLAAARDTAAPRGLAPALWRIHLALGKLYQGRDRRNDAQKEFAEARAIVQELAAKIGDDDLRATFLNGAQALLPRPRPTTARRAQKERFGGLTEREREIAALIAEGKSNREIADKLVLSERTVITHVSSIFNKLGFTSRSQIAVWAAEKAPRSPNSDRSSS